MRVKKGSALIFILCITTIMLIILTALLSLTASSIKNVDSYNKINSAYYAGEAGIERVVNIMSKEYPPNSYFSNIATSDLVTTNVKSCLDTMVPTYIANVLSNIGKYKGASGLDLMNQISTSSSGYYLITSITPDVTKSVCAIDLTYTVPITIISEGHYKSNDGIDHVKKVTDVLNLVLHVTPTGVSPSWMLNLNTFEIRS